MSKILVVDDVVDNVKLLTYELADHGYDTLSAYDGLEALEIARSEHPDLILLDVMMPDLNGIEVCKLLKKDQSMNSIPIILVSAQDLDEHVIEGLDAGAHDYITKPFNSRIVLARIRSALRSKQALDLIAEMNQRLTEIANSDGLTGLKNSAYFRDALRTSCSIADHQQMPLSLVMIDIDHFKSYNDTFGHPAGDEVLSTVSELLTDSTRETDVVARYGGEEFSMLLPNTNQEASIQVAERTRRAIEEYDWPLRPITASFGVSTTSACITNSLAFLEQADLALYSSKGQGRNRVTHHCWIESSSLRVISAAV